MRDSEPGGGAPPHRPNPMIWRDEEAAQGVFVGPPEEGTAQLSLMGLDGLSVSSRAPRLPSDFEAGPDLLDLMGRVRAALSDGAAARSVKRFDLSHLTSQDLQAVGEILGEGDVLAVVGDDQKVWQIQESVMAGLWRVRAETEDGALVADRVEVGAIPDIVPVQAQSLSGPMPVLPDTYPDGVMNVPPLLAEVGDRAAQWRSGMPSHVINFTLFPMTEADNEVLTAILGQIPVTIYSGGFGNCRIMATGVRNVWAVQYLNAMGNIILDTLEIGGVPESALAAAEDCADSATRLGEIMEAYLS